MRTKDFEKWLVLDKCGSVIADTFVPFKTPLERKIFLNKGIRDTNCFFTPDDLLGHFNQNQLNVGLIIDLTYSNRYYQPRYFESNGILHLKLRILGFNRCPTIKDIDEFVEVCRKFKSENPHKLIGVHCTHGINRTGFLICSYLIQVLNFDADHAVCLFRDQRPPGIQKQFFIEGIYERYNHLGKDNSRS